MLTYKLSRYWNSFAYCIVSIGVAMVWDQTGLVLNSKTYNNGHNVINETAKAILTAKDYADES